MLSFPVLLILILSLSDVLSSPIQSPFQSQASKPRKLQGRFLHITDIHPDPHYTEHSSPSAACHRKKPKKKKNGAGYYGTPFAECDSPFRLTNFTLDYLDENWASELDFVIWTGDSARHDNDRKLPRTPNEIYATNRMVAKRMEDIFTSRGIPVVPSLGNNDVWPHNILIPGPNSITNEYASIWSAFIPFPYLQVFQRGAYYSVEIVPNELAVVSLNTMYFYDSNKVVGGCLFTDPEDPGNLQFDWLEVQLKMYRNRNMQVYLSGHVPPSPGNYFPECYVRYVELSLRYQDTILGHLYGHMNVDHFFFLEAIDLQIIPEEKVGPAKRMTIYETLLNEFSALPKSHKDTELDEYTIVNVAPAAVPNPYLPSFRIFSYNATGNHRLRGAKDRDHGHRRGDRGNKTAYCNIEQYRNTWVCNLNESWHSDSESPSRSNQQWTPLGYAQYYIPDLKKASKKHPPQFELEYLTYGLDALHPTSQNVSKSEFQYPIPLRHLPEELRAGGLSKSKYAPYEMEDLTIGTWVKLGRRMVEEEHNKLRKRFRKYMYFGGKEE